VSGKQSRSETVRARMDGLTTLQDLTARRDTAHPLGEGFGYENPNDYLLIDPKKIVLEGPYVRSWFEDREFADFCAAIRQNQDIGQAIGIRTAGRGLEKRYILVYGMRRWKASIEVGLDRIPARDYAEISEEESLAIQLMENEARSDPHPVDTAFGFHLLVSQGRTSQAMIARSTGRDPGYVSFMRAAGEAIASLTEEDRQSLYTSPRVTVRAFQEIAKLPESAARREALLALARDPDSTTAQAVRGRLEQERAAFQARETRTGRSFRVTWKEDDLRRDPLGFSRELVMSLAEEQERLAERLRALEKRQRRSGRRTPTKAGDPEALAEAAVRLARAAAEMRRSLEPTDESGSREGKG
jgi:ParB/RepB/Spo0J family partition protein